MVGNNITESDDILLVLIEIALLVIYMCYFTDNNALILKLVQK